MPYHYLNTLRHTIRHVRSHLSPKFQQQSRNKVIQRIKKLHEWRYAKKIALYQAFQGEIDINELWRTAPLQGKSCAFPTLTDDKKLLFLPATPKTAFKKNRYGILEPNVPVTQAITAEQLDIIFMPLVAFDRTGNRLGMGSGYYDRTLAKSKSKCLIGLAYDFQEVPQLITQQWDVSLDAVITPAGIIWC